MLMGVACNADDIRLILHDIQEIGAGFSTERWTLKLKIKQGQM